MKNLLLIFVMLNLFQHLSFAQNQKIDSLLTILKTAKEDTSRINILYSISNQHQQARQYSKATDYVKRSLSLSEKIGYKKGVYQSYEVLSKVKCQQSQWDSAFYFAMESLKIAESLEKDQLFSSLRNLSDIYSRTQNWTKAIDCQLRIIKFLNAGNNKKEIADTYRSLGALHNMKDDRTTSIKYFEKAILLYEELGIITGSLNALIGIGYVYTLDNNYNKALEYYNQAMKKAEWVKDTVTMINIGGNIAFGYKMTKQYQKALEVRYKSYNLIKLIGETPGFSGLAGAYADLHQYNRALELFKKEINLNKINKDYNALYITYNDISEVYSKIGNYKLAYDYYRQSTHIKDSLEKVRNKIKIEELDKKYQNDKQQLLIEKLNTQSALKEEALERKEAELKQQNIQKASLIAGLILISAFSVVAVKNNKQKRKANLSLSEKNRIIEGKNKDILDSINYAKRLQQAILPSERSVKENLKDSFIFYKPKDIVAGDFYWMEKKNDTILFAAADCTGHGVPGAMVSVICNNALNRSVREYGITDPGKILDKTRDIVIQEFEKSDEEVKDGMDISLCSLAYPPGYSLSSQERDGVRLQWAGANNPLWILRNNEIIEYKPDKQPIGKYLENKPFTTHTIELQKHDTIYLFTDGYADQFGGEKGKKFKYAKLKELLLAISEKPMSEQKQILDETFETWKGDLEQVDDVCVIGVRV